MVNRCFERLETVPFTFKRPGDRIILETLRLRAAFDEVRALPERGEVTAIPPGADAPVDLRRVEVFQICKAPSAVSMAHETLSRRCFAII